MNLPFGDDNLEKLLKVREDIEKLRLFLISIGLTSPYSQMSLCCIFIQMQIMKNVLGKEEGKL